jgi:zinc protease
VKATKHTYKGDFQGNPLLFITTKKEGLKMLTEVKVAGNTMQSIVSDGKNVKISAMGQTPPMSDKEKENYLFGSAIFEEAALSAVGAKIMLTGIEQVEGKDAYVIDITLPKGENQKSYYDTQTGLRVQTVSFQETPDGKVPMAVKYGDYKEYDGLKFPGFFTMPLGPSSIKFELTEALLNPKLDDAIFKVQ